ncbi:Annexin [Aulographum hederae CBS 113979]|uniref:Annexin n=1 Tax=Aulographum hederae CBS 113979 TaxID=1176131 RepID=A0A6G1GX91_9PEZI|nr:Annexin [Aulographum hederae CBS 113979]
MAYNQPPYGGYPNQGPPPQQGYGAPPPQQQWGQPPPQQYGQQPPPQQWGQQPPPQQWGQQPPPQQGWGQPPPQQYGQHPHGAPPPQQGQWGAPQPGYGAPPPQQGQWGAPSPQPGYGAPPPGQYGAPPPGPPSHGYDANRPPPPMDATLGRIMEDIHSSVARIGTDDPKLVGALTAVQDPMAMAAIRQEYNRRYHKDMVAHIESDTSGDYQKACLAVARGPLLMDVYAVKEATKGLGTSEKIINDVLLGRTNADLRAIINEYQRVFHEDLVKTVSGELSFKTDDLFLMVLRCDRAEDNMPPNPPEIERKADELYESIEVKKTSRAVCHILAKSSDAQIREVNNAYNRKHQHKNNRSLEQAIRKRFSGHMEDALVLMLGRAVDRVESDARQIESAMAGAGTKESLLTITVVRPHWNRQYMDTVAAKYRQLYGRSLVARIEGETSSYFERVLVRCVDPSQQSKKKGLFS